jgi:dTDP-4-amino-4,6-dideoxygalactose transaminase
MYQIAWKKLNYFSIAKRIGIKMNTKKIFVTKPSLAPLSEFLPYLEKIWESGTITNGGPMHEELEEKLCAYLGVEHISLFCNGTIALVTALQSLRITGEVITTPYSFVATAHSLLWNGIKPIFVDVDPKTLNIDYRKIEAAISPQTTAILGVHCYGNPCEVKEIQSIADIYNLKVIYDAAHAFNVKKNGQSILQYGDLSVLSFHATKVFNTFEGGAIISPDKKTKQRIDYLKNFGFANETTVVAPGINGKMSEINSAFGLLQLQKIDALIKRREQIDKTYRELLKNVNGIKLFENEIGVSGNYSYFPILVEDGFFRTRDELYDHLKKFDIFSRRYFYPLISEFPMYKGLQSSAQSNLPNATKASREILCLPIYPELSDDEILFICEKIINV